MRKRCLVVPQETGLSVQVIGGRNLLNLLDWVISFECLLHHCQLVVSSFYYELCHVLLQFFKPYWDILAYCFWHPVDAMCYYIREISNGWHDVLCVPLSVPSSSGSKARPWFPISTHILNYHLLLASRDTPSLFERDSWVPRAIFTMANNLVRVNIYISCFLKKRIMTSCPHWNEVADRKLYVCFAWAN